MHLQSPQVFTKSRDFIIFCNQLGILGSKLGILCIELGGVCQLHEREH